MSSTEARTSLQLRSLVKKSGELEVSLASVPVPEPGPNEVLVRIEAAPINPSDLGLLFSAADMTKAVASGTRDRPVITAPVAEAAMKSLAARLDESMPVGNEGAGVVVAAGASDAAQALLGKTVAAIGGAMYSQYRPSPPTRCCSCRRRDRGRRRLVLRQPLTALGMVETMRLEGHSALVTPRPRPISARC